MTDRAGPGPAGEPAPGSTRDAIEIVGWAVVIVAVAIVAKLAVRTALGLEIAFIALFVGVAWLALRRGFLAGALVTILGAVLDVVLLDPPAAPFTSGEIGRPLFFVPAGLFISWIAAGGRAARQRSETARRTIERLYRQAEGLQATLDASPAALFTIDAADGAVAYANAGAERLLGFSRTELIGRSVWEILAGSPPDDLRRAIAETVARPTESARVRLALGDAAGDEVPIDAIVQGLAGDPGRVLLIAQDLRESIDLQRRLVRLASAERSRSGELRAVIDALDDGVAVFDRDRRLVLSNEALRRLTGGAVVDLDDLAERLRPVAGELPTAWTAEPHLLQLADPRRFLLAAAYPVPGESEADRGPSTVVVIRDVTGVEEARTARDAFVGVLSHELRTPVTTIYGYAKLLARRGQAGSTDPVDADGASGAPAATVAGPDRASEHGLAADIEAEADRLYRLVEDLLVLSRTEHQSLVVAPEPVLVQHLVERIALAERRVWPDLALTTDVPAGLPPVASDPTYLEQVLRNLIGNAAKYSEPGRLAVEVRALVVGETVEIRVLDRGVGFPADQAERLFDVFYRNPDTKKLRPGAGIGLYVTRALVEAMGGRVWARPREGGGSEFGFSVPIVGDSDRSGPAEATIRA